MVQLDYTEHSDDINQRVTLKSALTSSQAKDVISQFKVLFSLEGNESPDAIRFQNEVEYRKATTSSPILSLVTHANWNNLPTLKPALPATVQLSLTVVYIAIFGFIFVLSYAQLWMIWYYRHRRISHQTMFLFLCLVWSGLRTSLFSFYFKNCDTANSLPTPLYWLLYSFPVCLQFTMLCLLLHFFVLVVFKAQGKYQPTQYKRPLRVFLGSSVLGFIAMNIACAITTKDYENEHYLPPNCILYIRVSLTEGMFLIYSILLCVSIYRIAKMTSSRRVLEAKGTSVRQAVVATVLTILLFLSRAVYNIISVIPEMKGMANFGYGWINVSDQADAVPGLSRGLAYVSFGIVLFVWEVLPILIVVCFFRVRTHISQPVLTDFSTQNHGARVFFFDNPRRYDSEDDLTSQTSSNIQSDHPGSRSINGDIARPSRSTPRGTPVHGSLFPPVSARPFVEPTLQGSCSRYGSIQGPSGPV